MAVSGRGDCGAAGVTEPERGQPRQGGGNRGGAGATSASYSGRGSRRGNETWGRAGGDLAVPSYCGQPCLATARLDLAGGRPNKAGQGLMWPAAASSGRDGQSAADTVAEWLYLFF